jgi:hypothetical protein
MFRHQNAGQNHNIKIASRCLENMAKYRYFGTTITNQNLISEEIKNRTLIVLATIQFRNILSYRLLPTNVNIKIYVTIILPVVLYGCEISCLTLKKDLDGRGMK